MSGRAFLRSGLVAGLFLGLARVSAFAAPSPDEVVPPATLHELGVQKLDAFQILDVVFGPNGFWTFSDGIGD